jgi:hypothetical protein
VISRGALVAAAAACALLLAGCTATPLPEGPSDAEVERYYAETADSVWASLDMPDSVEQPGVERSGTITAGEWAFTIATCMNDSGYDSYSAAGGGLSSAGAIDGPSPRERVALYTCQARYPVEGGMALLTAAQRDYVYDYYAAFLLPCLELHDYTVEAIPSRDDFHAQSGYWSPYTDVRIFTSADEVARAQLQTECPPLPPGLRS